MKRKLLAVLLSVLLLAACVPLGAVSVIAETNSDFYYEIVDGEVTITGGTSALPADLTIPDTIEGYPVTAIDRDAFLLCNSLTSVTIPDSVTTIGFQAFLMCSSLRSVIIGNGVTDIGWSAFNGCSSLTSVTIGNSVTVIGEGTFWNCSSLTSVTIPDSVTIIVEGAFRGCSSLASVTLPDSVTTIGGYAFDYCDSLTDVYYTGSEADRAAIAIDDYNDDLLNATWHYDYTPEPTVLYGDANGDGRINNKDLGLLQQHLADWYVELNLDACDVNKDGKVNNKDLGLLQQYLADWDVTLG